MSRFRFSQVDVFTDTLTLGNPVAVVHDADQLTDDQMAAFARWTNLSETTYLLAPNDPRADYRLRIFTTGRELPFAGHPTLGSARAFLDGGGTAGQGSLVQECGAGLVTVTVSAVMTGGDRLAFAAPPLTRSGPVGPEDRARVAAGLRIDERDIVDLRWCDNGPGWIGVLLENADRVLALHPDPLVMEREQLKIGVIGAHRPGASDAAFEVRAFTPSIEDPVTGSLNAALAQWLIPAGIAAESYVAAQGTVVHRRGRVHVRRDGDTIWVGGDTVVGIRGSVDL